jgi:predicted transcriptional regulator
MTNREAARKKTQLLLSLREAHQDTVAAAQARLKEQKAVRRQICNQIQEEPQVVPEIATATGLPTHQVLWHITAMKKYDLVEEAGMCGEYYLYRMTKEAGS